MKPVPVMFEERVEKTPGATALIQNHRKVSYCELNEKANRVANGLKSQGVGPEVLVGISIEPSIEAVAGVLGILKAGGAYVPLDPGYPEERVQAIAGDAGLQIVIDRDAIVHAGGHAGNPRCDCHPDSAAYVIYTSGSTGKPKGVVGIHRSIVNGLLSVQYAPDERCCLNSSLSFGFSIANTFLPLMAGVPLVILSRDEMQDLGEFVNILHKEAITRVALVPPVFNQILQLPRASEKLSKIRIVGVGGAALTSDLLRRFAEVMPQARLRNVYSASEIGTLATVWEVPHDAATKGEIVIGRPVANTRIHLLDEEMNPVPPGTPGEICVGAPHLARGYINQPEETARRFVTRNGERLFRSGDWGRLRPDGEIEFLGRADEMVKIRGYRIELPEVEKALVAHEHVRDAAVAPHEIGGDTRLVGYIVSDHAIAVASLRDHLCDRLPEYMIPSIFLFIDNLPLSANGKVDRKALPAPPPDRPVSGTGYSEPRNETEAALAEIWSDLFGLERVGIHAHFIDLGGDSLFVTQFVAGIWERFGIELTIGTVFEHPTIAEIAPFVMKNMVAVTEIPEHE